MMRVAYQLIIKGLIAIRVLKKRKGSAHFLDNIDF